MHIFIWENLIFYTAKYSPAEKEAQKLLRIRVSEQAALQQSFQGKKRGISEPKYLRMPYTLTPSISSLLVTREHFLVVLL